MTRLFKYRIFFFLIKKTKKISLFASDYLHTQSFMYHMMRNFLPSLLLFFFFRNSVFLFCDCNSLNQSAFSERNGRPLDGGTALLFQHGPARHKDALAVHQTECGQARLLLVWIQGGPLAVAIGVEMWSSFEAHVDGRHGRMRMLSGVKLVQTRMAMFGPQVRRIEGAADGRQQIVRTTRLALAAQLVVMVPVIVVVVLLERDQRPAVAVGTRRLTTDVAAVLSAIFIAQIGRLLVMQNGRAALELVLLVVAARAEVSTAAAGVAFDFLVNWIRHHSVLLFRFFRQRFTRSSRPSQIDFHISVIPRRRRAAPLVRSPQMLLVVMGQSERRSAGVVAELGNQLSVHGGSFGQSRIGHRMRVVISSWSVHASIGLLLLLLLSL